MRDFQGIGLNYLFFHECGFNLCKTAFARSCLGWLWPLSSFSYGACYRFSLALAFQGDSCQKKNSSSFGQRLTEGGPSLATHYTRTCAFWSCKIQNVTKIYQFTCDSELKCAFGLPGLYPKTRRALLPGAPNASPRVAGH